VSTVTQSSGRSPISTEVLEAIRAASPIEQVAGEYTGLRPAGHELVGLCPLHSERTPSFAVNPDKGVFRCHGCGAGGDAIEFIRARLGVGFRDAVEHLAQRAGIRIEGFEPSPELRARVAAQQEQRAKERAFLEFCDARIHEVNASHFALARAATRAETALASGLLRDDEQDLAWGALERYRTYEAKVERDALCDIGLMRVEWQARQGATHAA